MKLGNGTSGIITAAISLALLCASSAKAAFTDDLQLQIFKYASDNAPTFYLANKSYFETSNFLTRIDQYFESGGKGTWSLDPDPLRFTFNTDDAKKSLIWFGREHPLNLTRGFPLEVYTALGSLWGQDNLEFLNPKVSGWIGLGAVQELDPRWSLVLAYSPIFLPTFGPSLGFTDRGEINPNRYARLPPASATTGGVTVPIRYKLQVGQLSQLLFQHQAFVGIAHDDAAVNMDAYFYTAPKPDPVPLTDAKLAVSSTGVNARVYINPQFPREYWGGMRIQLKSVPLMPALEFLQNMEDFTYHIASATAYFDAPQFNPFVVKRNTRASFGVLSHLGRQFDAPKLSDLLVYVKMPFDITYNLGFRTMFEATLMNLRRSMYWLNEIEYTVQKGVSVLLALRILAGQDNSYYGDFRDQGSYSIGVKWIW